MTDTQCTKMVKTTPAVGAVDRNPPDHRCGRKVHADGLCKQHHPQVIADKQAENEALQREWREEQAAKKGAEKAEQQARRDAIDEAILLLVKSGYTVTKSS